MVIVVPRLAAGGQREPREVAGLVASLIRTLAEEMAQPVDAERCVMEQEDPHRAAPQQAGQTADHRAGERHAEAERERQPRGALSGTPPYLVGSRFSVADIVAGGVLGVAVRVGAIEPSPTSAAYMESLAARPAWQRASSKLGSRGPV
jgi:glutathione S-transferase